MAVRLYGPAALKVNVQLVLPATRARPVQGPDSGDDPLFVYWYERRGRGVFLQATPIDVSGLLSERLFENVNTAIPSLEATRRVSIEAAFFIVLGDLLAVFVCRRVSRGIAGGTAN